MEVGGIQRDGFPSAVDDNGERPYMFFMETLSILDRQGFLLQVEITQK